MSNSTERDDDAAPPAPGFPDPVLYFSEADGERVVTHANDAYRDGSVGSNVSTGDALESHLPNEISAEHLTRQLEQQDVYRTTVHRDTASGPREWLFRVVPPDPPARPQGYVVYTELPVDRGEHRHRSESTHLERIVAYFTHDLRNVLDVAEKRLRAARNTGEDIHFEKVSRAHDRIESLTADLETLADEDDVFDEPGTVSLEEATTAAWATVETDTASLTIDDDLPTVESTAGQLRMLFENLFQNAIEHAGPDVSVEIGRLENGFYVADDGPGIADEQANQIFEPEFSTAERTGLGLTIVKKIVEAHGWDLAVATSDAGGARFEISGVSADDG